MGNRLQASSSTRSRDPSVNLILPQGGVHKEGVADGDGGFDKRKCQKGNVTYPKVTAGQEPKPVTEEARDLGKETLRSLQIIFRRKNA